MNILITGTGTMIGNSIANFLHNRGYKLICTYNKNFPKNLKKKNIRILKLDLKYPKKLKKINFDIIIHCAAAIPGYSSMKKKEIYKTNVSSFQKILDNSNNLKKIVLLSTMSIYGEIKKPYVRETDTPNSPDMYGLSKIKMEKDLIKFYKKNLSLSYLVLRLPGVLGKNGDRNFLCKTLKKIKMNENINISTPNALFNNCIHTDVISDIIYKYVSDKNLKLKNSIFNLGSKKPIKFKNVINRICKNFNYTGKITFVKSKKKPFLVDISKIKSVYSSLPTTYKCVNEFIISNK